MQYLWCEKRTEDPHVFQILNNLLNTEGKSRSSTLEKLQHDTFGIDYFCLTVSQQIKSGGPERVFYNFFIYSNFRCLSWWDT